MSILDQIKGLKTLRDSGDLTDEEFEQAKNRVLQECEGSNYAKGQGYPTPPNISVNANTTELTPSLGWIYPILIIFVVGLVFWIAPQKKPGATPPDKGAGTSPQAKLKVKPQHTYHVFPELIELAAKNPEGKEWDIDDSGPDITYAIYLNDAERFKAPNKGKDNTVKVWGGVSHSLFKTSVSVEGIIKAALISINAGDTLKIKIWDNDLAANDEAGEFTLKTTELKLGQTEWWRYGDTWNEGRNAKHPDANRGLKRLRLRVVDSDKAAEFIASQLGIPLKEVNDMLKKPIQ